MAWQYKLLGLLFMSLSFNVIFSMAGNSSSLLPTSSHLCHPNQSSALLKFKNSFAIDSSASDGCDQAGIVSYPKTRYWKEGVDCCSWDGVTCDMLTGNVIGLDLSCSWIQGPFNSSNTLFLLPHLQSLNLAFNNFSPSPISPKFGQFTSLTYLNLSDANFLGLVPTEISHLSKLVSLDLSYASDPQFERWGFQELLQNLTELRELRLDFTNMSSVNLDSLNNLSSSLITLSLEECSLHGKLPENVFHLPNLQILSLGSNYLLNVTLPSFNRSYSLKSLDLSFTGITGYFHQSIGELKSLETLDLSGCNFLGSIPASIGNLTKLTSLKLNSNHFTGHIPTSLSNLESLIELGIADNNIYGIIPEFFHNLSNLDSIYFSRNRLSGQIPSSIFNLNQLTWLNLYDNRLSGPLPSWLFSLPSLVWLDLSSNHLSGPLPDHISGFSSLKSAFLGVNLFNGIVPSWLFSHPSLVWLELSYNHLSGPLPDHISGFSSLVELELSNNLLNGTLPSWLFSLSSLTELYLSNNQFSGQILELLSDSSLEYIDFENNSIQGQLPNSFSHLVNAREIYLSSNNISGTLNFKFFSKLRNLNSLDLSFNNISLEFDDQENTTWPLFEYLGLSSCNLTSFPTFLGTQNQLQYLYLSYNRMQGEIPNWLWLNTSLTKLNISHNLLTSVEVHPERLKLLQYLDISHNLLTSVEVHPGKLKMLQYLDLRSNLIQAPLSSLLNLFPIGGVLNVFKTMQYFYVFLSNNKLTGEIPISICNISSLAIVDFSNNSLSGAIPECLGSLNHLSVLNLRMNNFNATIPQNFSGAISLRNLNLNGNQLEGSLPKSLANCKKLEIVDIGNNNIQGEFPNWLESLPKLQVLILRSNRFYGSIGKPNSMTPFQMLRILDISNNTFTGFLPTEYFRNLKALLTIEEEGRVATYMGDSYYQDSVIVTMKDLEIEYERVLTILATMDFSMNNFGGHIPKVVGNFISLEGLNFSHNNLSGQIPSSLANMVALESLDLSFNELVGVIPQQLANLNFLGVLNISYNQLEGPIPERGQFGTFENDSYMGNFGLCGFPLSRKCGDGETKSPPTSTTVNDGEYYIDWKFVMMGYATGLVFGLSMSYIIFTTRKPLWFVEMVERKLNGRGRRRNL